MTTLIAFHEVADGAVWARAWQQGPGSRHEMFAKIGVKTRTFRDPENPNRTGVLMEVPDMECASCHGGGPDRMDVQPLSQAACLDCHEVTEHFAPENDCSTCHLPLIRAVDLTAGQIAAFPTPCRMSAGARNCTVWAT